MNFGQGLGTMYHIEKGCSKKLTEYMYSVLNLNEIIFLIFVLEVFYKQTKLHLELEIQFS